MAASTKRLADIDRSKTEPIDFDDSKLGKVKPPLAPAEGFGLSSSELRNVFGMRPSAFGSLPRRIVIPDLKASAKADGHSVTGYLYIVEPVAWVPRVRHGTTIPLSVFKKPNVKEEQPVLESALNKPGVAAQLATNTAGAYVGTKAEPLTNNPIHSTATKAGLEVRDNLPPFPIHQLTVFPMLRVRALKQQRIDLQVNAAKKLTWTNTEKAGYWDKTVVTAKRLSSAVGSLQLHPLPLEGPEDLSKLLFILPVPRLLDSGELEAATLVSRSGWPDWYLYEENAWVNAPADKILTVAAPQNQTAFQAVTTWAPLTEPDDHCGTDGQESNGNKYTNNTGNNTGTNTSQSTKPQPTVQTDTNKDAGVPKTNTNTNTNTNNNINTNGNSLEPSKPKVGPVVDSTCEDTKPSNKPEVAVNPLPNTGNANTNTNINTNNSKPQNSKPEPITDSTPKTTPAVNSGSESKPCDTTKDKPLDGKAVPTNTNTNTNINGPKPEDSTPIKNDPPKSNPTSKTTPTVTNPVFDSKPHDNAKEKPTDGKAVLPNANTNTNTNTNNSIPPKSKPDPIIESTPKTTPTVVNPGSDHKPCDATQGKPVNGKPIPASTDADINDNKPIPNTNTNANTNVNGPKPEDLNPINKDLPKTNPPPKSLQTAVNPIFDSQTCGDGQDKPVNDKPTSGKPVPTNTNTNTNINDTPAKAKPASDKPIDDKPIDNKPVSDRPIPANANTNTSINDKPIPTNTNTNFNDKPINDTPINGKHIPTNTNTNTNINGPKPEDSIPIKKDPTNAKPSLANTNDTKPVPTNTNTNTNVNGKPVNTEPVPTNTNTNTNINSSKPEDLAPIKQDPPKTTPKVTPPQTTTNTNVNNTNTNFNGNLAPNSWPFHGTIILRCPCCPPDTATITISPPPPKLA